MTRHGAEETRLSITVSTSVDIEDGARRARSRRATSRPDR